MPQPSKLPNFAATLSEFLSEKPLLKRIATICAENSERAYLTGGALRNLLLGAEAAYDIDILVTGDESKFKAMQAKLDPLLQEAQDLRIDLVNVSCPRSYVLRFDYTVNTLLADLLTEQIIDPTRRGVIDISDARLSPVAKSLLYSNPHGIVRGFRLSTQYDLNFSEMLKEDLQNYRSVLCLDNENNRGKTFGELLYILSLESVEPALRLMIDTGILSMILPEITIYLAKQTAQEEILSRIDRVDQVLATLPPSQQGTLCELKSYRWNQDHESGAASNIFRLSPQGLLRFACVCFELSESYLQLDEGETEVNKIPLPELEKNFFMNMASRLKSHPILTHAIREVSEMLPRMRRIVEQGSGGRLELPRDATDGSLGLLASLLAMAELAGSKSPQQFQDKLRERLLRPLAPS